MIEELLKGKEFELPDGHFFKDKDGNKRNECRVKWWTEVEKREYLEDVLMECPDSLKGRQLKPGEQFHHYSDEKPVFFGHYWLRGEPTLTSNNAVCVDYSVAKQDRLVAYRWDGPDLHHDNFVQQQKL